MTDLLLATDSLPGGRTKLNQRFEDIAATLDLHDAVLHSLGSGVNYIKTALTGGGATALDGIDGANLSGGEYAGVFLGTTPANLYFYVLSPDSGASEAAPGIIAPDLNPGTKRWLLAARLPRVWLGAAAPVVSDDLLSDHVKGDRWIYDGNLWTCVDHAAGAAVWLATLKIGTGAGDAAAGNHGHSGYATLVDGKVPQAQLPSIALVDTHVVASQAAMLALTAETGDVAVRTDVSKSFILLGADPTQLSHWQELLSPTGAVASVDGRAGTVTLTDLYLAVAAATATPTASKIPIADESGKLDGWVTPDKGTAKFIPYTIDGGGAVIAAGAKGFTRFGFAGTIVNWTLIADQSGSVVIDIWKHASGAVPTASDKITSTTGPALASAQTVFDSTSMSGWTTSVAAGDVFGFYVSSCTTITRVALSLKVLVT